MVDAFVNVAYNKNNVEYDATFYGMNFITTEYIDGVENAPDRVREISQAYSNDDGSHFPLRIYNPKRGYYLGNLKVNDYGNIDLTDENCCIGNPNFPVFVGSDHGATYYVLKHYAVDKEYIVLQFDAHGDYLGEFEECLIGSVMKRINMLPNVKKIVHCGLRGNLNTGGGLRESVEKGNVIILKEDLNYDAIKKNLNEGDNVYLTIDIDFFDPTVAPGTHHPEPNGIYYEYFRTMITKVFKEYNVIGFDIVEYAPQLDPSNITGNMIVNIILEMLGAKFNKDY